jgi:hypothetical protein
MRKLLLHSAMKTGDEAKARTAYTNVLQKENWLLKPHYDAYFKNKDGKFEVPTRLSKN